MPVWSLPGRLQQPLSVFCHIPSSVGLAFPENAIFTDLVLQETPVQHGNYHFHCCLRFSSADYIYIFQLSFFCQGATVWRWIQKFRSITEHNDRMPSSGNIYSTQEALNGLQHERTIHSMASLTERDGPPNSSINGVTCESRKKRMKILNVLERR